MPNVLVTGAGGFIGSHLVDRLVRGNHVRAFVRYNSRGSNGWIDRIPAKKSIDIVQGDLRDSDAVKKAMEGIDVVYHLGALISIPYSYVHPMETVETNVVGTLNVLTAARDEGVKKVVHTSTSEVYGSALYCPIDEDHPKQPQSPYSASKISADAIALSFNKAFDLPVAIVRPFNTYGPRQSGRAIIPTIITQALDKGNVEIGSMFPTRDFTFVHDTVDGFVRAARNDAAVGNIVNLGYGEDVSIGDLARKIVEMINPNIQIVFDKKRARPKKSEVSKLQSDNGFARKLIGWKPSVSLNDGLKMTIEWFYDNLDLYKTDRYVI